MLEFLQLYLPICVYILLIILLVVGIILGVRLINAMDKIDLLLSNVENKINSLNGLFELINYTNDKVSMLSDKFVSIFTSLMTRKKKNKRKEDDYE